MATELREQLILTERKIKEICPQGMVSASCGRLPDDLRMNDFWCEIKVNHQMLCDLKGKRCSIIDRPADGDRTIFAQELQENGIPVV